MNLDDFTILASRFGATLPVAGDVPRLAPAASQLGGVFGNRAIDANSIREENQVLRELLSSSAVS